MGPVVVVIVEELREQSPKVFFVEHDDLIVDVQDLATPVLDHEEDIEESEGQRQDAEEIHRREHVPVVRTYLDTVRSETRKPSLSGSPWIRGAPHRFSFTMRATSSRSSASVLGRPGWRHTCRQ